MSLRDVLAFVAGKAVLAALRAVGRPGHHIPGMVAYRISPSVLNFIRTPETVVFVTGTNGKSTTTALVRQVLAASGRRVAYNTESNTQPGVIAGLLRYTTIFNRSRADVLVLEVGEEALPVIAPVIVPDYLLLTNVQKDAPQVNQSPNYIRETIASIITDDMTLLVNAEDPDVSAIGRQWQRVRSYGIARNRYSSLPDRSNFAISRPCPVCQSKLEFDYLNLPNVGHFRCTSCDFSSQQNVDYRADAFDLEAGTITIDGRTFPMHYRAAHFAYDYVLAYACAKEFGVADEVIVGAFARFINIEGRLEELHTAGKTVHYVRFKQETPDTLSCGIDYICRAPGRKTVVVGLNVVENAWGPAYTNTAYGFDADLERLAAADVDKFLCVGKVVAYDTANLLRYAGVPREKIVVFETDDPAAITRLIGVEASAQVYLLAWLHHFQQLREVMTRESR